MQNRAARVVIGLIVGGIAGGVMYGVISGLDMDWKYGPRVPMLAGVVVGVGIMLLIAASSPRKHS